MLLNGLRQLYKDSDATFKSIEQAEGVKVVFQGKRHVLAILPTGGGKSLLWQLPIFLERNKTSVIILPYIVLVEQVESQCIELGLSYQVWENKGLEDRLPQVIIVAIEHAIMQEFQNLLIQLESTKVLRRIVIDECHTLVIHKDFRSAIRKVGGTIRSVNVQVIMLSATIPPRLEDEVRINFGCLDWKVIRKIEDRREIDYCVWNAGRQVKTKAEYDKVFIGLVSELYGSFESEDRGIIYCLETKWAEQLALQLSSHFGIDFCIPYHAKMDKERRTAGLSEWKSGKIKFLVGTSALGAGLDYSAVRAVIHHIRGKNMIEFIQETGRAGRDGEYARALTVYWNGLDDQLEWIPVEDSVAMKDWIESKGCRKELLSIMMNGVGENCLRQGNIIQCDNCRRMLRCETKIVISEVRGEKRRREMDGMSVNEAVMIKRMVKDLKRSCSYCWIDGVVGGSRHLLQHCRYII
jgi:superfamily II DNA helicase RecQ